MSDHSNFLSSITESLAPIHRDGHKFVAIGIGVALLFFVVWPPGGWIAALVTAWIAYFFRDPDRVTPLRDGLVIAPADGRIAQIEEVRPPMELGLGDAPRLRISTFLSIFNVHVNRAPVAGRVVRSLYVPGAFFNAAFDKASEDNERRALAIETGNGTEVAVVQIAGFIARRIVTFVGEGDAVGVGQRIGLIRFGQGSSGGRADGGCRRNGVRGRVGRRRARGTA